MIKTVVDVSLVVTELVMTRSCMIAMAKRRYKQNTLLKLNEGQDYGEEEC